MSLGSDFARAATPPLDTASPEIRSITTPNGQTYGEGGTIAFRVNFTESVIATGVPTLPITIGDSVRQAEWNGRGSGSKSLTFTLPVRAGDSAPAGVRVAGPIVLSGGAAIRDRSGNELNPAASGEFPRARVDAVGPSVSEYGPIEVAGKRVSISVTFTEPVTVRGNPSISFTLDGAPRQLVYARGSGSNVLIFTYRATRRETPTVENVVVPAPIIALSRGRIIDRAGNAATSISPPTEIGLSAASLPENEPTGTVAGVLSAVDADGARDRHTFTLVGGAGSTDNAAFEIIGNQLRTARPLDHESQTSYLVRVRSTDSGGLSLDKVFTLTVTDVNEAPTGVVLTNTLPSLPENTSTASRIKVADIVIADDALGTNSITLTGTDSGSFEVDGLGLFLKSGVALDFETKQSCTVTVSVADASLAGVTPVTAGFTLTVTDVNDVKPVFTSGPTGSVAENAAISTAIYTAVTTDADGTVANRAVTYSIKPGVGDATQVSIDSGTGVVKLVASADFEVKPSYAFTVVATNVATGATLVTEQAVAVTVTNVNDAPTGVVLTNTLPSLPENTSTASRIKMADIVTTDDALGTNTVTLSGTDSGSFEVDGLGLFLKSGVALDFETTQSYAVTVSVADASLAGVTPITTGFTLTVTDVNDVAPVFTSGGVGSVAENAPISTVIYTAATTDADGTVANRAVTYSIKPGVGDAALVSIDSGTGVVKLVASADYEAKPSYTFTVVAANTATPALSAEQSVTVGVRALLEIVWSTVGNAGNAADTTGYGAVNYEYRIGAHEVTIGQYTTFLNAVASSDPYSLYNPLMGTDAGTSGISRSGSAGSYTYSVIAPAGMTQPGADSAANRPITYVSWFDAARFANWMHNGQGFGSTETGAYTISTGVITAASRTNNVNTYTLAAPSTLSVGDQVRVSGLSGSGFNVTGIVTHVSGSQFSYAYAGADAIATGTGTMTGASATASVGALYRLPTENEWYKAAYYSPVKGGAGSPGYYVYATQSDSAPGNTIGNGANQANYYAGDFTVTQSSTYSASQNYLTNVGAFTNSASYYGTYDQSGNVWEWGEVIIGSPGSSRGLRGGYWLDYDLSSSFRSADIPSKEYYDIGFRLASPG